MDGEGGGEGGEEGGGAGPQQNIPCKDLCQPSDLKLQGSLTISGIAQKQHSGLAKRINRHIGCMRCCISTALLAAGMESKGLLCAHRAGSMACTNTVAIWCARLLKHLLLETEVDSYLWPDWPGASGLP